MPHQPSQNRPEAATRRRGAAGCAPDSFEAVPQPTKGCPQALHPVPFPARRLGQTEATLRRIISVSRLTLPPSRLRTIGSWSVQRESKNSSPLSDLLGSLCLWQHLHNPQHPSQDQRSISAAPAIRSSPASRSSWTPPGASNASARSSAAPTASRRRRRPPPPARRSKAARAGLFEAFGRRRSRDRRMFGVGPCWMRSLRASRPCRGRSAESLRPRTGSSA